ncbi:MAG: hypothetical protein C0511_01220 [Hyphomicrobium sp.]|nr:hypothetical protein [Hyphomicrobium sp.]
MCWIAVGVGQVARYRMGYAVASATSTERPGRSFRPCRRAGRFNIEIEGSILFSSNRLPRK